ncbi:MAG: hypothetical protein EAZ92_17390 [Candidatus Kapaibacterium sp.]|nr:MAG: hypothetical protein EAZ92_17390 [Candidatus Kapabacteria bacterium]
MTFRIKFGVPEMAELWDDLRKKAEHRTLSSEETALYKRLAKAILLLEANPRYPGLQSHEIEPLSRRYGIKVWQSYLQNNTPAAGRIFWVYAPEKNDITIIGLEPHPESTKARGYESVKLSELPV